MSKYIELVCGCCGIKFSRLLKQYKYAVKIAGEGYTPICSNECLKRFRYKKQTVICENCEKSFDKSFHEIKNTQHNFCSCSCAALFNNKQRSTSTKTKEIYCRICNEKFIVIGTSPKKVCKYCKSKRIRRYSIISKHSKCLLCNVDLTTSKHSYYLKKYCDSCRHIFRQELGKRIGKLFAAIQVRRSKNEIYFAELCKQNYINVTTNELFFDSKYGKWDADVIIHEHKIAILWNGVWHYKQVRKDHSLIQVQSRDKIKLDVIKDNGYIPYIIRDNGKFNKKFVDEQFELFQAFLKERK